MTLGPGDYEPSRAAHVSGRVLSHVYRALNMHDVVLEATLLKPSMVRRKARAEAASSC